METQTGFCQGGAPLPPAQLAINGNTAFSVALKDDLLSVDAKQIPWQALLKQIRDKSDIPIHYDLPLTGSVTVSFTGLPIKEALERLFGPNADFIFRYQKAPSQPSAPPLEVWVLGKDFGQIGTNNTPPVENAPPEAKQARAETNEDLLDMTRHGESAEARTQALANLSGHDQTDEGATEIALNAALSDKDPKVREYAVEALATQKGIEATEQLRQALQDPDPGVRIKAVENVTLDDQGIVLLQEARSSDNELIQAIAADRLKQAEQ